MEEGEQSSMNNENELKKESHAQDETEEIDIPRIIPIPKSFEGISEEARIDWFLYNYRSLKSLWSPISQSLTTTMEKIWMKMTKMLQ